MTDVRAVLQNVCALVEREMPTIQTKRFEVRWKGDGSPVTDADIYLESVVHEYLRSKLGADVTFLGEETFESWDGSLEGWVAVLDPIDGTENFVSGLKEWGVSLALWRDGAHAGSLLLLPELGEKLMTGDDLPELRSRITGFSSSISATLVEQLATAGEARIMGCAVYNLYNVTRGTYRRFVNPVGAYSWDLLAGVALATEHGCEVEIDGQAWDGRFLEPGRRYRVDVRHRQHRNPRQGSVSR